MYKDNSRLKGYNENAASRMTAFKTNPNFYNDRLDVKQAFEDALCRKNFYGEDLKEEFVKRLGYLTTPRYGNSRVLNIDLSVIDKYDLEKINATDLEKMIKEILV